MTTVTFISKETLSGTSNSLTFSTISSDYSDLRIIGMLKSSTAGNFNGTLAIRLNGITSNDYKRTAMGNENANLLNMRQDTGLNGLLVATGFAGADNNANNRCIFDIYIPNYTSSRFKSLNAFSWSGGYNDSGANQYNYQWALTGQLTNTSVVTSVTLYEVGGGNLTGNVSLYGIS